MLSTETLPHGELTGDEEMRSVRGSGERGRNPSPGGGREERAGRWDVEGGWEGLAPMLSNWSRAYQSKAGLGLPIVETSKYASRIAFANKLLPPAFKCRPS